MKLILMSGLQGSGKSTKAKEIQEASGNCVRLNKDLIRTMLHFDKFNGRNEGMTKDAEYALARLFLSKNLNVIIDDTNLGESHKQAWQSIAKECNAKFEIVSLDVPVEECLNRNIKRGLTVPSHVIVQTAMQYCMLPTPSKPYVLCDIDGTVADITHRLHFVKHPTDCGLCQLDPTGVCSFKKDWKSFFDEAINDVPRLDVIEHLLTYATAGHKIIFVSGRPDNYRDITMTWLEKNVFSYPKLKEAFVTLYMRRSVDKRDDDIVKQDIFDMYLKHYPVEVVFDDRPRVIRMWRENNVRVIDVGKGIEF